jgi:cell division protein FtsB
MSDLSTSKINKIVDVKVKKNDKNNKPLKSFQKIFIDFDIITYIVGFIIALSFHNLLKNISKFIIKDLIKINNDLVQALFEFILILIFVYILIYFVYYKFILTEDVASEKIVKHAIKQKKVEKAKKEIDKDKETSNIIEKDIDLVNNKSIEEYFTTQF